MKTMKFYLFASIAAMLFVFAPSADAQIGIKASGLLGTVYGESEIAADGTEIQSIKMAPGWHAGVFFRAGDGLLSFQGELLYESRTSRSFVIYDLASLDVEAKVNYGYVSLPLLAVLNVGNFKPYVGLNVAYMLSANGTRTIKTPAGELVTDTNFLGENEGGVDFSDDPYFNRFEIGANLGVMFQVTEAFHLDVRAYHSLNDITNNKYDTAILPPNDKREDADRAIYFQLGVGFSF